ncbi:MAG: tripartite tricarboxylate transporter substrate-binding protein [Polaromonas sp.]|uniref:tripartite tricarboxylate transporter substrate-binding protein n=1 Tax=Polaromonas sp. TaxID=1869339 RepID=UPI0024890062|nr:tripartite tricarboxylate transporter substrate-binding protein [Polaromonas sp.]MDI1269404.1 tripartite tricarboxylate transporter substrate-binding protein [Polaromonas sp.]
MKKLLISLFAAGTSILAAAQAFPEKPVTLIVPFAAGGPTDVVARHLAIAMAKSLGQPVIVENRASTGGIVGTEMAIRAEPNGYTLLIHNIGMSTLPALSKKLRFDPTKDFEYVGQVADVPMILVARRDFAPTGFKELQTYIGVNQKKINLANAGVGTASHLCGLLLMSQLQVPMTTIPYKGAAPAMVDIQGGQVDLLCDQATTTLQPIITGRVKPYGTTTRSRLKNMPELATLSEQGLNDFEVSVWHGVYAPKKTPSSVMVVLVKALQDSLEDPAFKDSMQKLGAIPASRSRATPKGLETQLKSEMAKWSPLIKQAEAFID